MKKKVVKAKKGKRRRLKTYKVVPFNIHIKGPVKNKGYETLFARIERDLNAGNLIVRPNSKGVVIRCTKGRYIEVHDATLVSLLKYNQNSTGLAYDLSKEELVNNTSLVSAQVVTGIFFHKHHVFALIPKAHGPSDSEIEDYLIKIFDLAVGKNKTEYSVDVEVFKQEGVTKKIESWDVIKSIKIEVFRNNPINDEVGNKLSDLADLLESDKLDISARSKVQTGINKKNLQPLLEGGDRLNLTGRARITAEGIIDGEREFIDTKESKTRKIAVKSYEDDEGGLVAKVKESITRLFRK